MSVLRTHAWRSVDAVERFNAKYTGLLADGVWADFHTPEDAQVYFDACKAAGDRVCFSRLHSDRNRVVTAKGI